MVPSNPTLLYWPKYLNKSSLILMHLMFILWFCHGSLLIYLPIPTPIVVAFKHRSIPCARLPASSHFLGPSPKFLGCIAPGADFSNDGMTAWFWENDPWWRMTKADHYCGGISKVPALAWTSMYYVYYATCFSCCETGLSRLLLHPSCLVQCA